MTRRGWKRTLLGATALAVAVSTAARSGDAVPPAGGYRARGSLLRLLRADNSTPPASSRPIATQRPAVNPVALQPILAAPETAVADGVPEAPSAAETTRTVQFRRSDGVLVRKVVYDDLRRDISGEESAIDASAGGPPEVLDDFDMPPLPSAGVAIPLPPAEPDPPAPSDAAKADEPPATEGAADSPLNLLPAEPVEPDSAESSPPDAELELPPLPLPLESTVPPRLEVEGEHDVSQPLPLRSPLSGINSSAGLPAGFSPWWHPLVMTPLRDSDGTLPVVVDTMVCQALSNSPHVAALQADPEIRRTQIVQEQARFDWKTFVETRYDDISDPVGNTLTTGGPSRLKNQKWNLSAGARQQNALGGELEAAQKFGWEDSNSRFFEPSPQRTARLQLSYTQPLLQGSGRAYNESRIVLAQINTNTSLDQLSGELQDHLLKVASTYWDLYRARAVYLQRLKFLDNGEQILETLEARQEIDALRQQILRAKAAVASRRTSLVRAEADVRNAESRLKLLVNHPALLDADQWEIIPSEHPRTDLIPLDRADSLNVAMMYRPDISQATQEIRAAGVRLGVAENELLPRLDLILSSYLYGLTGQNLPVAYANQLDTGRPSFAAGLNFEMPIGNRAAQARQSQREWELSRAMHEYRAVVQAGMTDVEVAVREVQTAYLEMVSRWEAMGSAYQEADYLKERWLWLGGSDRAAAALLEELLLAQERLVDEEEAFVASQVRYVVSLSEARKAMGTLMQCVPEGRDFPVMPTQTELPPSAPVPMPYSESGLPLLEADEAPPLPSFIEPPPVPSGPAT